MNAHDIDAFEARAAEAERRLSLLEQKGHASPGLTGLPKKISDVLLRIKADLDEAKAERARLVAEVERLNTELAKQRYRVDGHILPYIERLRVDHEKLRAMLQEHQSVGGVSGIQSEGTKLSLSSA